MDVGEFTSELVKYIPASKWVQGGKSLISRLKRGFLGYGGTETISEIIEKQLAPEVNRQTQKTMTGLATDVAIPTAIGMAADVVVPPALKYGGKAIKGELVQGLKVLRNYLHQNINLLFKQQQMHLNLKHKSHLNIL